MANTPHGSLPALRVATVCIDCDDADLVADFYGRLLGWDVKFREPGCCTDHTLNSPLMWIAPALENGASAYAATGWWT